MDFQKGDLVIAGFAEFDEAYLARIERVDQRGTHVNPIVRPLRMLRYPKQQAICVDTAHETPPCQFRGLYRMPVIALASAEDVNRYPDWETSVAACIQARIAASPEDQQLILARHLGGRVQGCRAMLSYHEYEIR